MFNTMSGTVFQGTKIPLVRFFQFFVMIDATGPALNPKDILYVIDVSNKTAASLKARTAAMATTIPYIVIDPETNETIRRGRNGRNGTNEHEKFYNYCETEDILINVDLFQDRIREIVNFAPVSERDSALPDGTR